MTKEEKNLLIRDLCARLPYGIKVYAGEDLAMTLKQINYKGFCECWENEDFKCHSRWMLPYLRPMSSMTSQEWCELCDCDTEDEKAAIYIKDGRRFVSHVNKETFLNSRHFDYRGLIEKGLAIEVTKENNPYKE